MNKIFVAAFSLVAITVGPSFGEETSAVLPNQTTETFGAWTVRCANLEVGGKSCEMTFMAQGQAGPIAQVAIGQPAGEAKPLLVVQTPLGSSLAHGVRVGSDTAAATLPFVTCLQIGCLAQGASSTAELTETFKGDATKLAFTEMGGRVIELAVPTAGFLPALERMGFAD